MFRRIFLSNIDNLFRGKRIALWIFIIVLIIKTAQNLFVIIGGASIISSADGIPLERYSQEAAQTIVYLWTYVGFIRLLILILGFLILFRYRSLIPLMFVFLLLQDISRYIITYNKNWNPAGEYCKPCFICFNNYWNGFVSITWR